jgi:hypothetical protein
MDIVILVLLGLSLVAGVFTYVRAALLGGTRSHVVASSDAQRRALEDLGPVRRTFTNYTPWRFRFGLLLLAIGTACGLIGRIADNGGLQAVAWFALLFGAPTMLYVALMRVDRLDLHARGLVLREGRSKVSAAYYSDVKGAHYETVVYRSGTVPKALVINLYDGSSLQIGNNFMQFGKVGDALQESCAAEQNLAGTYLVVGRSLNDGEPMEVELDARSPQHARTEALNRYGVIAEDCRLRA